jgi:hypothetical protein
MLWEHSGGMVPRGKWRKHEKEWRIEKSPQDTLGKILAKSIWRVQYRHDDGKECAEFVGWWVV